LRFVIRAQSRINSELKKLADTQRNRVAIHAAGNSDRVVTHFGWQHPGEWQREAPAVSQRYGIAGDPPAFPCPLPADSGVFALVTNGINHSATEMLLLDRFPQNDHLVRAEGKAELVGDLVLTCNGGKSAVFTNSHLSFYTRYNPAL
jgi:hypothetical protein